DYDEGKDPAPSSPLARALRAAARLRDFKNDDAAALRVLEGALSRKLAATPIERARALAAVAELCVVLGNDSRSESARAELAAIALTNEERERHREELEAADRLLSAREGSG
ncbi:MAG TPA: hypothetical protein VEY30_00165, partial [Myxococcaceae bacterium]|nr:hypothetical protein [Myxococcaceae bacterium]